MHHQRSPKEAANQGILLDAILADLNERIKSSSCNGTDKGGCAGATPRSTAGATMQVSPEPEPEGLGPEPEPQLQSRLDPTPVQLQPLPQEPQQIQPQPISDTAKPLALRTTLVPAHPPAPRVSTVGQGAEKETTSAGVSAPVLAVGTDAEEATRLAKIRGISARPASASPRLRTSMLSRDGAEMDAEEARLRRIREIASRPKSARARPPPSSVS